MASAKRYAAALVLGLLSLVFIVVSALALTIWSPPQEISASMKPNEPYVMVREGVTTLYPEAKSVSVEIKAADSSAPIWVAAGAGRDVVTWLYGHSYDTITGTKSDTELASVNVPGKPETPPQSGAETESPSPEPSASSTPTPAPSEEGGAQSEQGQSGGEQSGGSAIPMGPNPIESDMWTSTEGGSGTLSFEVDASNAEGVYLIVGDGTTPVGEITFTWPIPQPNILAWIAMGLAGLFLLATIAVIIARAASTRRKLRLKKEIERRAEADETATGAISITDIRNVTGEAELGPEVERATTVAETTATQRPVIGQETRLGSVSLSSDKSFGQPPIESGMPAPQPQVAEEPVAPSNPRSTVDARSITVTTESGMMNMAALQGGGQFPTRRALREAGERGVENLVVDGRNFSSTETGATPIVPRRPQSTTDNISKPQINPEHADHPDEARSLPPGMKWRSRRGADRFGEGDK